MLLDRSFVPAGFQSADEVEEWAGAALHDLPDLRALRVLVVDDNQDAADSLCMLTELWGHEGERAYDGFAALELLADYRPDVMLLDIGMPKMDGYQLARAIRGQPTFSQTLLIALTGYTGQEHRWQCAKAGFDHLLLKPAEPAIIQALLLQRRGRSRCRPTAVQEKLLLPASHRTERGADAHTDLAQFQLLGV